MNDYVRLNLVFPPHLEDAVTEALITAPDMPGFTLLHGEGHSSDFGSASVAEKVRGRIERRILWVLIPAMRLHGVLDLIRTHCDSREVRWWTEAVLEIGTLAE